MSEKQKPVPDHAFDDPTEKRFRLGEYHEMPRWDYDTAPGISQTMMRNWVSGEVFNPGRRLIVGNALHDRMRGPEYFRIKWVEAPNHKLNTVEGKKAIADIEKQSSKLAIRQSELQIVINLFKAIAGTPIGARYISSECDREMAMFGRIGVEGSKLLPPHTSVCKGMLDLAGNNLWDLKTTNCTGPAEFEVSIAKFGYHAQMALYQELYRVIKDRILPCKWLCVSMQAPHNVWVQEASPLVLNTGRQWLNTVLTLIERGRTDDRRQETIQARPDDVDPGEGLPASGSADCFVPR